MVPLRVSSISAVLKWSCIKVRVTVARGRSARNKNSGKESGEFHVEMKKEDG